MIAKDFVLGTLRLDAKTSEAPSEAQLETNSRERFKKWECKLRTLADVVFLEKKEESMEAARNRLPEEPPALPMLGVRTPVEAVRTPEGRKLLQELFDSIENRSGRSNGGRGQGFDVDEMKQRLGLGAF